MKENNEKKNRFLSKNGQFNIAGGKSFAKKLFSNC